jgi:hypothetical protein
MSFQIYITLTLLGIRGKNLRKDKKNIFIKIVIKFTKKIITNDEQILLALRKNLVQIPHSHHLINIKNIKILFSNFK